VSFAAALKLVLQHEGGWSNHPSDPGGMTNLGVTKRAWEDYVGRTVSEGEMRALTPDIVTSFYEDRYWHKIKGDELPVGVGYCVFDACVNSGPKRAIMFLQAALGTAQDGVLGPVTLKAAQTTDPKDLIEDYSNVRLTFLKSLPTWGTFGKGWERRVNEVEADARKLAGVV
jgi:lysozyme family protein